MQGKQHRALLAEQQQAGSLAVKPVRKFKKTSLRPLPAQRLDHPEALAAAAMHGDTGRLVHDQQALVFIDYRQLHLQRRPVHHFLLDPGRTHRRNTHHVTGLQTVGHRCPPPIDSHLAATHNAVNMALRHPFALLQQQIVQALSVLILGDQFLDHGVFANFGHIEYTLLVLRLELKEALTRETVERRQF